MPYWSSIFPDLVHDRAAPRVSGEVLDSLILLEILMMRRNVVVAVMVMVMLGLARPSVHYPGVLRAAVICLFAVRVRHVRRRDGCFVMG